MRGFSLISPLNCSRVDLDNFNGIEEEYLEPKVNKAWRFQTLEEQDGWCNVSEGFGCIDEGVIAEMRLCASQFIRNRCDGCNIVDISYLGCKKRRYCARCANSYARSQAAVQYAYLLQISKALPFDLKMNQLTLTVPEELETMNKKLFVEMVKLFLSRCDIEDFAYEVQTARSSDPLGTERIHAHVLTFNFKYDEKQKRFIETKYYFDVDKLRSMWKAVIQEKTGITIAGDVDLHNEYASVRRMKPRCLHILAYLYRYPVTNLYNAWKRDSDYMYLRQIKGDSYFKRKDRLVWCGWLSPRRRRELEELLHTPLLNLKWIKKQLAFDAKRCHKCHEFYTVTDRGRYAGDNEPVRFER